MSAKRIAEALGGSRRAWLCACRCPANPRRALNLIVVNVPNGVRTYCLYECDQRGLARDFIDLGVTPLHERR